MVACCVALSALLFTIFVSFVEARSWRDVELIHDMNQADNSGSMYLQILGLQLLNDSSYVATRSPSDVTTNHSDATSLPSPSPSDEPTNVPTNFPSDSPSSWPTHQPSDSPSEMPSAVPTPDPYPKVDGLNEGERGFFNYDLSPNSPFGPSMWGNVLLPEPYYWDEFGENGYGPWKGALSKSEYLENHCDRGLKHQSPIDVYETISSCNETHEIRDHNGDFPLNDILVEKRIESNMLRLIFPRRPCPDINNTVCQFPHPPWADFPNGFRGIADATHIDFKIPSEHWLRGEKFDGEMQTFHMHPNNSRAVAISTLIRASTQGHNQHFQLALDAFQVEFNINQAACSKNRNNGIMNTALPNATQWAAPLNSTHRTDEWNGTHTTRDLHDIPNAWSPYLPDIMPSIYFYRYEGSITEPPCSEFVTWFVTDTPMTISNDQLEQWRAMQFTNVDPKTCTSTSVQYERSVARPIKQPPPADRIVTRCTAADFGPDRVRSPAA